MKTPLAALLAASVTLLGAPSAHAQAAPRMADDFASIMNWLTKGTAEGLGFNAGSSFDPPNEMRPWRLQPDVSLGVGLLPFDKKSFPRMSVQGLEDTKPSNSLPDQMMFPNLTLHMRMGLPGRWDIGTRFANMTTPSNYKLSPTTVGNGQSNTLGFSIRRHFMGGDRPLLSVAGVYNHTFGFFNFSSSEYQQMNVQGSLFDYKTFGQMEWDVRSFGVNAIASQSFGKWIPFGGFGYNRMIGSVSGKLESQWKGAFPSPAVGQASNSPSEDNGRVILGFQRDGSFFKLFMNTEIKAMGTMAGKSFIISTGLAAPFKIGASSSLVREGRNRNSDLAERRIADPVAPIKRRKARTAALPEPKPVPSRVNSYWTWDKTEAAPPPKKTARETQPELIFIR